MVKCTYGAELKVYLVWLDQGSIRGQTVRSIAHHSASGPWHFEMNGTTIRQKEKK